MNRYLDGCARLTNWQVEINLKGINMKENKTQKTDVDPIGFLEKIQDAGVRQSCLTLVEMMRAATGAEPKMWGESMFGFGDLPYKYASGREGNWFKVGFSPRKQNLTLYLTYDIARHSDLLAKLGKHTTGKGCLYIKRLEGINLDAPKQLFDLTVERHGQVIPV
jgi:hypothetical protein